MRSDREYERPSGWSHAAFDAAKWEHPGGPWVIRSLRRSGASGEAMLGVWGSETGSLLHVLADVEPAAAQWSADGTRLVAVNASESAASEAMDLLGTVYSWPGLSLLSERPLSKGTAAADSWLALSASNAHAIVMQAFPGFMQSVLVLSLRDPHLAEVARLEFDAALPLSSGALSPDERFAAFLSMHWWSSADDQVAHRTLEVIPWGTLVLVNLADGTTAQHSISVRLPVGWSPGDELEDSALHLANLQGSLRFESPDLLAYDVPWGGTGRVAIPPGAAISAPEPLAPARSAREE